MLSYICLYRKYYPAETRAEVWDEVPCDEGYAMIAGGMSLDGWLQFSGVTISDGAYLRQEVQRLMAKEKP